MQKGKMNWFNKYIIVSVFFSLALSGHAQWYSFSESKSDYQELDSSATIGHIVDYSNIDQDLSIPIGFSFKFHDRIYDSLYISKILINYIFFYFKDSADYSNNSYDKFIRIIPWAYFVGGINGLNLQTKLPMTYKYKTNGTIGNRVSIFEWQQVNFYKREMNCGTHPFKPCVIDSTVLYYCNLQLWLYENNGDIELHFGKSFFPESKINTSIDISKSDLLRTQLYGSTKHITTGFGVGDGSYSRSLSGWPEDSSVYKFYFNYSNQVFLNDYSTLFLDNNIVVNSMGAITGQNFLLDNEWAEKYYVPIPVSVKGMICQNYGITTSDDSATFSIYSVGTDGLPDKTIYQTERPYSCLKLDKSLNYISFDSAVSVKDSFFVAFGLKPYERLISDTIGICYANFYSNSFFPFINSFGRTAVRGFNKKWYDVYSIAYLSDWISDYTRENDLLHFALAAVINFDVDNQSFLHDSLYCRQISNLSSEILKQDLTIFPIPAKNNLNVHFSIAETSDVSLIILNNAGIIIEGFKFTDCHNRNCYKEIDVSNYPNGLYLLLLTSKNNTSYGKFIIQQ